MNEYERRWIEILTKAYPNLHNQDVVMHTSKESDKKVERIRKYFERLDRVHEKVSKSHRKADEKFLKSFYYNMYIIKEKDIPESYFQNEARIARERGYGNIEITDKIRQNYITQIIEDQKSSLDKWIEYFLYDEESKTYKMWEKYWVFQGIVGLGKYNKETHKFSKRDESTVYAFPDLNREAVFNTLKLMEEYIKDKKSEEEIKSALGNGNFKTLYEYSINQINNKGERKAHSIEGKWIKYEQGSDYKKLRDSLQGYQTGWCTAAGENFAKSQLKGGDFYVYYSIDENKEARIPRIAIRMEGKTKIGEIRGIANNQNMEAEMMPILEEKLKEFPDRDKYYKKERDMKILTLIDKKVNQNEELTVEELKFLYEINNKIDGFEYKKDPRIQEIKSKRNIKEDLSKIYNVSIEEISTSQDEYERKPSQYKILYDGLFLDRLTSAEGLKLPQSIGGDLLLNSLTSVKGLELPQSIGGGLNLASLTSAEGLKLPQSIGGSLDLYRLTSAEGLKLPQNIGKNLWLNSLTSAKGLELPQSIGGSLSLGSLTSVEGLKLPQSIGGSLWLDSLTSAEGLKLPQSIGGDLRLNSLTSAKGLKLPQNISGDLSLNSLTSAKGLELPQNISGDLSLNSLTSAKGLELPQRVGKGLYLDSLISAEGLELPQSIGRDLYLDSLTSAKGLKLPQIINGDLRLNSLTSAEGLKLPQNISRDLRLNSLTSAEGLELPQSVGRDLRLNSLTSAEGLKFPQSIGGSLLLNSLTIAEGLELPQSVGRDLRLNSLTSAEGLKLPQSIGGDLWLDSLTSAERLELPQSIGRDLRLNSLTSAEGLKLPQNIGEDLYLNRLTSAKGLELPINFDLRRLFCPNYIKKEIKDNPGLYYQNYQNEENETLKR